jgi:hypothetical protein
MKSISFAVDKGLPQTNKIESNAKATSKKSKNKGLKKVLIFNWIFNTLI